MSDIYRGSVYGVRTLDPYTLAAIELGYVGKSRQPIRAREAAHRDAQPWADIIVGSAYLIAEGDWADGQLAELEESAIALLRPRYNVEHNDANQARISLADAVQQRQARDRTRGVPVWLPLTPLVAPPVRLVVRPRPPAPSSILGGRGLHEGHRMVLAHLNGGTNKTGAIAEAMGYSNRQVYNLLMELIEPFGLVEKVRQGFYRLARRDS